MMDVPMPDIMAGRIELYSKEDPIAKDRHGADIVRHAYFSG
jgi:hypothetical protein